MTTHRTPKRFTSCLLVLGMFLALLVVLAILIPALITARAEQTYGPPSPQLGSTQRFYLSTLLLLQSHDLTRPVNPQGKEIPFTIQQGESVPSIVGNLWEAGLISNPGVFRNYLQYSGLDTSLKSGDYLLNTAMTPVEIAQKMQTSISPYVALTILAGWRIEEIANSIPTSGLTFTPAAFLQAAHSHPEGYSFSTCMKQDSLEGYLFPGSYSISRETTIEALMPQILMNFEANVTAELKNGFSTQGLDLCQAVTLASIIQREAVREEEMPIIASVFYNRLNAGMALESDPTVQYSLGYNHKQGTWWTNPLSLRDLKVNEPYNTYLYKGLPPGPISNPGLPALQAVAFPAQTPYFYFRSACDNSGHHVFAETYNEHVANACP